MEEMPYGYTWPFFMRFAAAAMLSMFAGAQCVHAFYKPLSDLDEYVEEEKQKRVSAAKVER